MEHSTLNIEALKFNKSNARKSGNIKEVSKNDIAIIGMYARFPMADNVNEFWDNIVNNIDCVYSLPESRKKDSDRYMRFIGTPPEDIEYFKGAYIDDIDKFDNAFFNIPPNEARLMDPAQRLFLEAVWNAIEDAGYSDKSISGSNTGIFLGHISDLEGYKYKQMILDTDPGLLPASLAGTLSSIIPSRISYILNLKGPSMMVDTACSSSLVAVDLACQSLRNGSCDTAVVGAVRLNLLPVKKEHFKVGIESSDNLTRTFDEGADGSGVGEGVAAILLKPLSKAMRDGDNIYAVIKGSAVNQDGRSMGITAPNPAAQTDVIIKAWENSGIDPACIAYIDTHGTATKLGDPIEIEGIQDAFKRYTEKRQFCAVSSVKSNIGHLYDCAGMASLIKAVLALKNSVIPPSANFNQPNHKIDFSESPVYVNVKPRKWETNGSLRRCGISSFGLSGTNCHVVLEEYPGSAGILDMNPDMSREYAGYHVLTISAKSVNALKALVKRYKEFTGWCADSVFEDFCFTVNTGRSQHSHRLAVIAKDIGDLKEKLDVISTSEPGSLKEPWLYYGVCRIASGSKEYLEPEEFREGDIKKLDEAAFEMVKGITTDKSGNLELLQEICGFYIKGAYVNWEHLYRGKNIKKISLPAYPFERCRCWLEIPETPEACGEEMYYAMDWKLDNEKTPAARACNGPVLVLGACGELTVRLKAAGREVIEARLGTEYKRLNSNTYIIDGSEKDYRRLIEDMKERGLQQVIHLLTINLENRVLSIDELEKSRIRGTDSLFYLTRAIMNAGFQREIDVVLISNHVNRVTGKECINPENAPLIGLGKVVRHEYPEIVCRAIDIDHSVTPEDILAELDTRRKGYQVAFRDGKAYVEAMTALDIDSVEDRKVAIKEQGVYVITGGTGKLGLIMARHLASEGKVKLALINRTPVPGRDKWEEILHSGEDEEACRKIKALMEIEAAGAETACYSADVASLEQISPIINDLRDKHGRINGVIHAAGLPGNGFIISKDKRVFDEVLRPKIEGTWVIDSLTDQDDPDFFVMFSSGVSIIGEVGQGDYTAANSFMDAYSVYRKKAGRRTLTINWVVWKGARMAKGRSANIDGVFKELPPEKAVEAFDNVLRKDITRVLVGELNHESEHVYEFLGDALFEVPDSIKSVIDRSRKLTNPHQVQKSKKQAGEVRLKGKEKGDYSNIEKKVAEIYKEVLGYEEINIYDSFFEMGGDSIQLSRVHVKMQQEFPGRVKISDLFAYTSVAKLANYLTQQDVQERKGAASGTGTVNSIEEIAIIGMSARFPGAEDIEEYWDNIRNGIDCIRQLPERRRRLSESCSYGADGENVRYFENAYLEEIDEFDYKFFRLSPREASLTDPHQRLFLQTVWHAIEDAGYGGERLTKSKTGVYMGFANIMRDSYQKIINDVDPMLFTGSIPGNISALMPTRISYLMDLRGPTMVIDTACSSTLVAIHVACNAMKNGDCDLAAVGGIKLFLDPVDREYYRLGIEASDGRTRAFDDNSDGAGMGEGVGAVILKPLSRAEEDGDNIYAVIKGSAINQDGASIGITAPNPEAQTEVILQAWENAGIHPETIAYYEGHATGTKLGDPIEVEGLMNAFRVHTQKKQFCAIGTVKTNVGHLNEGAGIASLIKAVMVLRNREIPPSLHFNKPNSKVTFHESPVYVNTSVRKWNRDDIPMRCAISSFGFSGTNCHLILEEYRGAGRSESGTAHPGSVSEYHVLAVSAVSAEALRELVRSYAQFTSAGLASFRLKDICHTANTGRGHYAHRLAIIVKDMEDFKEKILSLSELESFDVDKPWLFYRSHMVVNDNKGLKSDTEITSGMKIKLSEYASAAVEDYLAFPGPEESILKVICDLYVKGGDVRWEDIYKGEKLRKVSLPIYPFERIRCWIEPKDSKARVTDYFNSQLHFTVEWKPEERLDTNLENDSGGVVLVFADENGVSGAIAERLRDTGREVVEVDISGRCTGGENREDKMSINPQEEAYRRLISDFKGRGLSMIVHLSTINQNKEISCLNELEDSLKKGVHSLFHLFKGIIGNGIENKIDVVLVSRYVNRVTGEEDSINPENAPLFGLGKAIRKEHPNILCRCIDIDAYTHIDEIVEEIKTETDSYCVAYRQGKRYVELFAESDLENAGKEKVRIRDGGVYLITGGTGGIGLAMARYISSKCNVRLALVNRSKMPDREKWNEILDTGPDARLIKKIECIRDIEESGSRVQLYTADVADMDEMKKVLNDIKERHGRISGVIHGAGIAITKALIDKDLDEFEKVLSPKIQGTWVLDRLTREDAPDFFVMFSSVATIFDTIYQGDYIAANSYMDSYSAFRRIYGGKTLTVNWPAWKDTGMAVDQNFNVDTLFKAISTRTALEGFEKALNKNISRVLIGEMNFDSRKVFFLDKYSFRMSSRIASGLEEAKKSLGKADSYEKAEGAGRAEMGEERVSTCSGIEKKVVQVCKDLLGFAEIDVDANFFDLGADSILIKQMYQSLEKHFPGVISVTDVFEYETIAGLSGHIARCAENSGSSGPAKEKNQAGKADIDGKLNNIFDEMEKGDISIEDLLSSLSNI